MYLKVTKGLDLKSSHYKKRKWNINLSPNMMGFNKNYFLKNDGIQLHSYFVEVWLLYDKQAYFTFVLNICLLALY